MSILLTTRPGAIDSIKEGDMFVARKDVVMRVKRVGEEEFRPGPVAYKKGQAYRSEKDGCITNEQGNRRHSWNDDQEVLNEFFRRKSRNNG